MARCERMADSRSALGDVPTAPARVPEQARGPDAVAPLLDVWEKAVWGTPIFSAMEEKGFLKISRRIGFGCRARTNPQQGEVCNLVRERG